MRPGPIFQTRRMRVRRPTKRRMSLSTGPGRGSDDPKHQEREHHGSDRGQTEKPFELPDYRENEHDDGKIPARNIFEHEVRPGSLHRCSPSTRGLDLLRAGDEPKRE